MCRRFPTERPVFPHKRQPVNNIWTHIGLKYPDKTWSYLKAAATISSENRLGCLRSTFSQQTPTRNDAHDCPT